MPISSRFARFAPKVARFLLTAISDNLPHARRLVHAAPLSATDGGDNGDYTVSVGGATGTTRGVLKLAGQLGGVADSPDVRGLRATGPDAPALLPLGDIAEGQVLARVDDVVVGIDVTGIPDALKAAIRAGLSATDQARVDKLSVVAQQTFYSEAIAYTVETKVSRLTDQAAYQSYKTKAAELRAAGKNTDILDGLIAKRDAAYVGPVEIVDAPDPGGRGGYTLSVSADAMKGINDLLHLNLPLTTSGSGANAGG